MSLLYGKASQHFLIWTMKYRHSIRPIINPIFPHALGLPVAPHIRKWRNMLLWITAQKLPLKTKSGTRNVWCLLISEVPFLYGNVIWRYVSSERRQQLHEAAKKGMHLAHEAYQHMQREYHEYRQSLFTFLRGCADIEQRWEHEWHLLPSDASNDTKQAFHTLLQEGQSCYHDAAALAREILQEQATNPLIDALIIGGENKVVDSFSMPLFPVIDTEKRGQFALSLLALAAWHRHMASFSQECQ